QVAPSRTSLVHLHVWARFGAVPSAQRFCGNYCGNHGHAKSIALSTAFYQCFSDREYEGKNLRLHRSWALTFQRLQLGLLTSTVERLSQNKTWLSRSRLGDQVQRSDSKHTLTRKNRQVLRGIGWGQRLRKQWSHQGL